MRVREALEIATYRELFTVRETSGIFTCYTARLIFLLYNLANLHHKFICVYPYRVQMIMDVGILCFTTSPLIVKELCIYPNPPS